MTELSKMEKTSNKPDSPWDWPMLITTVMLVFMGVFIVFDASYARSSTAKGMNYDSFYFLKRQALWAVIALFALRAGMSFPYWKVRRVWFSALVISVVLLIAVMIPGVGIEVNGSRRWLGFGLLRFQPSEFAKLALVVFLAAYSDVWRDRIRDLWRGFVPPVAVTMVVGGLIAKEDLGTAISTVATGLLMLYAGGARLRHMAGLFGLVVLGGIGLVLAEPYRIDRIVAWVNPIAEYNGPGYQPFHGTLALGSGGLFGNGLCRGVQKVLYLPAEHTDYIFATWGEETGLVGTVGLLGALTYLVVRGLTIAHRSKDWFGAMLAGGLVTMVGAQTLLNVAVVAGAVPATGVPLPFISYGGSSLIFTTLAIGTVLNISQYPNRSTEQARQKVEGHSYGRGHGRARVSGG